MSVLRDDCHFNRFTRTVRTRNNDLRYTPSFGTRQVLLLLGHGQHPELYGESTRVECRIPGADVNPYLGISALLAAGLDGIERELAPPPELHGNAYASTEGEPFPGSLHEAIALWQDSPFARAAFGEEVWRHYLNYARTEQRLFDAVVTCYERERLFERG